MKTAVWLVALVASGAAIFLLRAETMTVNVEQPAGSRTDFVVEARTRSDTRHLHEMTRGLVSVCRLLVNSDLVERSFHLRPDGVFTFSLEPALDKFDLREMRGCLQDTRVRHLLVEVRSVDQQLPSASTR